MNINALRNLSYGVYIVTTWDKGRPTGCTANSAMQITSEPPTLAVSINVDNYTNSCIKDSGYFALNVLSESSEPSLIGGFGFTSGRDTDKFDGVDYDVVSGLPVIKDGCAFFVCKVRETLEAGTHTVFLAEITDADMSDGRPMTYAYYHEVVKGKTAKNAPTYIAD